jgi:hypothetical protein
VWGWSPIGFTKADKGNTLVIILRDEYNKIISEFLTTNNFTKLTNDITNKQQIKIRKEINKCQNIIKKEEKWKYINMNPSAPLLHGTIKLHKQGKPIRPTDNWKNCPAYKVAKHLNEILRETLQLPYTFNVRNSTALINALMKNKINETTKMCSFDIANMYTNIPTTEVRNIINEVLNMNNIKEVEKEEILNLIHVVLEQNYIQINTEYYVQKEGLAMGAPTSAILAEVFSQYLEPTLIANILNKHQITDYHR